MGVPAPHFLLFSESRLKRTEAQFQPETPSPPAIGHWRFVLESLDGSEKLEADDEEPLDQPDRLELLAVVRGLEALDQPSRVTLVTPSRYVSRGLRFGLEQWRESGWLWERYGRMAPVKNSDLWQRVDRALAFHRVECRTWQFDQEEDDLETTQIETRQPTAASGAPQHLPANASPSSNLQPVYASRLPQLQPPCECRSPGLLGFCRRLMSKILPALNTSTGPTTVPAALPISSQNAA